MDSQVVALTGKELGLGNLLDVSGIPLDWVAGGTEDCVPKDMTLGWLDTQ